MNNPLPAIWKTNSSVTPNASPTVANRTARVSCTWRVLRVLTGISC
jgi:hypothetical protein